MAKVPAKTASGSKTSKYTTGAPLARIKPGDFVMVTIKDEGVNAHFVQVGMVHAVSPSGNSTITSIDVWFGALKNSTKPIVQTFFPSQVQLLQSEPARFRSIQNKPV